jgi:ankyrin repeat protein
MSALFCAADSDTKEDIVKYLLSIGADVNFRSRNVDDRDFSVLHWACLHNSYRVAEALIRGGADAACTVDGYNEVRRGFLKFGPVMFP